VCLLCSAGLARAQVTVTATWDRNTDQSTAGYRVFVGTTSGVYPWSQDAGNAVSIPLTLSSGSYYVVVRAYNTAGNLGPPSNEVVVDLNPPGPPGGLSASTLGSRVTLSWSAPGQGGAASGYLLFVGTAPGVWNVVQAYGVGNVLTVAGDLGPGRYSARAQAVNSRGAGPLSEEISFVVGSADAPAPPGTLAWSWTDTVVTLSWGASVGASTYIIEAGSRAGSSDLAVLNAGASTRYSIDVPPGTYYARVRGSNAAGASAPSNEIVLHGRGLPDPPTMLTAGGYGNNADLRWNPPVTGAPPTGYMIEAGTAPGLADLLRLQLGPGTSFSAPVTPGTYYVRVRSTNARGAGPPSNEIVVRR
jgi:hypothetical protein